MVLQLLDHCGSEAVQSKLLFPTSQSGRVNKLILVAVINSIISVCSLSAVKLTTHFAAVPLAAALPPRAMLNPGVNPGDRGHLHSVLRISFVSHENR